ncbi:hypothetical protein C5952_17690 [Cronobacter sakazakii]|nr:MULTISPECIES: hypothetical protein [Cronobacter]EJH4501889.1 hypothetical protein [Cronobacter sakazakii]EJV9474737.1 hypothetical protein [Cronobacter sakazakii]ELY2773150.1 hypothetical protein [Cronobacter sakazakii]ELY6202284.1 hypothetical protein [Cronobacter malonaticus]ELY6256159.1 hypothetical protein [Cronobacter malonaticus]
MKNAIYFIAVAFMLSACDDQSAHTAPGKPTVAQMIANGTEKFTFDCSKGQFTTKCEILAEDLLGSRRWHHAQIFIFKDGRIDLNIDGGVFYPHSERNTFLQEARNSTIILKGGNGYSAKVTLSEDNYGMLLILEGFNKDAKRFMIATSRF